MKLNHKLKIVFVAATVLASAFVQAQNNKYVIYFTDKNGSPYSIGTPSAYLSARAIQRRVTQNIPIQIDDLPVNQNYISQVEAIGVTVLNRSKWFNAISIFTNDTNKLNSIKALPFVQNATVLNRYASTGRSERVDKFEMENLPVPLADASAKTQSLNYGQGLNQIQMLGGDLLHDLGYKGEGTIIAVMDGGFSGADNMNTFDSLRAGNQILGTRDFVDGGINVYGFSSHGSSVLSTMGANVPGTLIGTAPKASYYLIRTEDTFSEYPIEEFNWASGAEYADSVGADVINSSLGYTTFDNPVFNHTYANQDGKSNLSAKAAARAASKGIMVVIAAGNEGGSSFHYISSPADADSVLSIGATDGTGVYAGFSSTGPSYDGRIKPNVAAQGQGAVVAYPGGGVGGGNGTSFASPIIAGLVACLKQANPTKTYLQLIDGIQQSASQYNNPDSLRGYGIPNFNLANMLISGIQLNDRARFGLQAVFPNPFHEQLQLLFLPKENETVQIQLLDISGRVVLESTQKVYRNNITMLQLNSTSNLSSGFYLLRVTSQMGNFEQKVIRE
jgi:serine protease AprX